VCVWGGVLAVIKCIYLAPTYLHFVQDIEDSYLLLTSSMSFVDLRFQEHRMMEKDRIDQNPYISSLRPKLVVVSDNMTRGDDVAKRQAQLTQGGFSGPLSLAGQPGFGANEITLSTRVMLSR
jgi:hypothetical protein